jgi:hypothetical protein
LFREGNELKIYEIGGDYTIDNFVTHFTFTKVPGIPPSGPSLPFGQKNNPDNLALINILPNFNRNVLFFEAGNL